MKGLSKKNTLSDKHLCGQIFQLLQSSQTHCVWVIPEPGLLNWAGLVSRQEQIHPLGCTAKDLSAELWSLFLMSFPILSNPDVLWYSPVFDAVALIPQTWLYLESSGITTVLYRALLLHYRLGFQFSRASYVGYIFAGFRSYSLKVCRT